MPAGTRGMCRVSVYSFVVYRLYFVHANSSKPVGSDIAASLHPLPKHNVLRMVLCARKDCRLSRNQSDLLQIQRIVVRASDTLMHSSRQRSVS